MRWQLLSLLMLVCASSSVRQIALASYPSQQWPAQPRGCLVLTDDVARSPAKGKDYKDLFKDIKDGVDLGNAMLTAVHWPLMIGLSLLNTSLGVVGAFITWFTFLVGFLKGGPGADLLTWLRADPPAMAGRQWADLSMGW